MRKYQVGTLVYKSLIISVDAELYFALDTLTKMNNRK